MFINWHLFDRTIPFQKETCLTWDYQMGMCDTQDPSFIK